MFKSAFCLCVSPVWWYGTCQWVSYEAIIELRWHIIIQVTSGYQFISAFSSCCVHCLKRRFVSQDAVVQVGRQLEHKPIQTGKGRGQSCPGFKVRSGRGVERVTVQRAELKTHSCVQHLKNGIGIVIQTRKYFWMFVLNPGGKRYDMGRGGKRQKVLEYNLFENNWFFCDSNC